MTTITPVNVGTSPDDDTGDSGRDGFIKLNTNIDNLNTDKVEGPVSSTDGGIALFDGTTGKLLKESPSSLSDFLDKTTYDPNTLAKDLFSTSTQVNVDTNNGNDTTGNGSADAPFATIQKGIDSITDNASSKRYTVNAKGGTYTENITLKSYVNLQGLGVVIQGTTGPLVTFTGTQSFVLQTAFILNPTTSGQAIIAATGGGFHEMNFCEFTINTPVNVTASITDITSANVLMSEAITIYSQTGTSATVNSHEIFKISSTGNLRYFRSDLIVSIEDQADNVTVYADDSTGSFFTTQLQASISFSNGSYSGAFKMYSFTGTSSFKVISWCTIDVVGNGTGTGILFDIDSSTNDITVENFSSRLNISGFATNMEATIGSGDTLESFFATINETDGVTGAGKYEQYALWNFFNGTVEELVSFTASSNGTTITASVEKNGGGDLTLRYSTGRIKFDSTPAATVTLTAGTDTVPVMNYVFIPKSTGVLTANTTGFPSPEHTRMGIVECKSAATDQTDGVFGIQNTVDELEDPADNGHMSHMNEWIRNQSATYVSGMTQSSTGSGTSTVTLGVTSGEIFQLHKNTSPTFSDPADLYVINDSTTAFRKTTNLATMTDDSTGSAFSNSYFALVLWQKVSSTSSDSRLYINLPSGAYNSEDNARADGDKFTNFSIPEGNKNTGVLIHRYICRIQGGNLTIFAGAGDDLRGTVPNTASGSSSSTATVFQTPTFRVQDGTDATKQIALGAANITTGTTRTYDVPDANGTLVLEDNTATLTEKRITERTNTITSSATPTPAGDTTDVFTVTALAVASAFAAPTGTPTNGQVLLIRIKDNATARALTWNAIYRASTDLALPATTIISKTLYLQFVYNSTDSKWDLLGLLNNF